MEKNTINSKINPLIITVVVVVVVGIASFFGGMKYQQSKLPTFGGRGVLNMNGTRGTQSVSGVRQGFQPVAGEISANDGKTLTVKLADGSSKLVVLSDTTTVSKTNDGTKEDLVVGTKVAIFGTTNTDGSVTAQNVQLNPAARMFGTNQGSSR